MVPKRNVTSVKFGLFVKHYRNQVIVSRVENVGSTGRFRTTTRVALASDVKSIVRRYAEKLKDGFGEIKPINILTNPEKDGDLAQRHQQQHVQIDDNKKEAFLIGMIHESKIDKLRKYHRKKVDRPRDHLVEERKVEESTAEACEYCKLS
ncbi:hypothetical protein OSTOST_14720 [Ostertagia ostertagi]